MANLYRDYLTQFEAVAPFFAAPPQSLFDAPPVPGEWNAALAAEINAYQDRAGAGGCIAGNEVAIVTGQQTGIFTGPLYTVAKGVTAVISACLVRERFVVPAVPIFWIHGDDHDFEEVRTTHVLTKHDEPFTLLYSPEQPVDGWPMNRVPIEPSLHDLVDAAARETSGSEHRSAVAAFLHDTLDASDSLADWFARCMGRLFRDTPLVLFAPDGPEARKLAAGVLRAEIERPLASTDLVNETGGRLEALGYPRQVQKQGNECNFFVLWDGRREKVLYREGRFDVPGAEKSFDRDAMLDWLEREPGAFTPNVVLRPVVQQRLFPVTAYVGGPGEIAYWAQLKPVFEAFGLPMPRVYPRVQCTFTTIKLNRLRHEYGFSLDDLRAPLDELIDHAMRQTPSNPAYDWAKSQRAAIEDAIGRYVKALEREEPAVAEMAAALSGHTAAQLDRIERAILNSDAGQVEVVRKRVTRLSHALAPWRQPQDRVYSAFSFLFQQGLDFVPRLLREFDVESFAMQEIVL